MFACRLLESKADLSVVRESFGQANVTITSRHLKTTTTRIREATAEASGDLVESLQASELP